MLLMIHKFNMGGMIFHFECSLTQAKEYVQRKLLEYRFVSFGLSGKTLQSVLH